MFRYAIRRSLWGLVVILVVTLSVFVLFGPILQGRGTGDPARLYAGKSATPAQLEQVRETLGLDKPYWQQYTIMLKRLVFGPSQEEKDRLCPNASEERCKELVGRLGRSFEKQRSVDSLIKERIGVSISLAALASIFWLGISIPIGILSAIRPRSLFDRMAMVFVLIGQTLPIYYFGLIALYFLTYKNTLLPPGGYEGFHLTNPWPWFSHMLLPAAVLSLQFTALYVRIIRGGMMDAMGEDYVRTARAKGSSERRLIIRHALRNALLPVVTLFGLDLGILLGGAILTEATFGLNGIGQLSVESATHLDVPLATGVVLFAGIVIVIANIIVDLLYALIDPRIRLD